MTSDAKIGLLLGLVFIFIIAFVINGLPRFHNVLESKELAATRSFVQDDPIGAQIRTAGVIEDPPVEEEYEQPPLQEENNHAEYVGGYENPWNNDTSFMQTGHANRLYYPPNYYTDGQTGGGELQTADSDGTQDRSIDRLIMQFPFNISNSREVPLDNSANRNNTPSVPPGGQGPRGNQGTDSGTPSGQQGQTNFPKTYVVQEGDRNLSKIAKKFYGEEEGNRWINVNKIYETNKELLKSPDKIFIGQTIVIPPPAPPVQNPTDVLRGPMFQTVPGVGGGRQGTAPDNQNTGRWYEVKEDDSLWKIAKEQLGQGGRFNEISELNADILTNENNLKPGMKILLPAQ